MADQDLLLEIKTITEALYSELYNAIACAETLKPILYDKDVTQKFNNTHAANIFNYLQHAIHRDGISCIWRIWDPACDSNSIPALMIQLDKPQVLDAIRDRRRNAKLEINNQVQFMESDGIPLEEMEKSVARLADKGAEEAANKVDDDLAIIKNLVTSDELRELMERSKEWRDRHVAHNTELTRRERKAGVKVDPIKWGELEKIVELTSEIVVLLKVLVEDVSIFPDMISDHYGQYSSAFWGALKDKIK